MPTSYVVLFLFIYQFDKIFLSESIPIYKSEQNRKGLQMQSSLKFMTKFL